MIGPVLYAALDPVVRSRRTQILNAAGIKVVEAATSEEALAASGQCQVALIDPALARALPGLKSGSGATVAVIQLLPPDGSTVLAGTADVYLHEPVPDELLTVTVEALLKRSLGANKPRHAILTDFQKQQIEMWIESSGEGTIVFDGRGHVVAVNSRFLAMHGITGQASRPKTLNQYFEIVETRRPDGANLTLGEWPVVRAREGQTVRGVEVHCRNRHTGHTWIAIQNATPLVGSDGALQYVIMAIQDITEVREQQRALAASEDRFRAVTEAMPNLVWMADPSGRVTFISPQWLQYTGGRLEETLGGGWSNALHPDDAPAVERIWAQAVAGRSGYEAVYRLRRRDGAYRWHVGRGVPQLDPAGNVIRWCGSTTDIQDQKEVEFELRRVNAALLQTNAELKEFAYAVSHELQEPLRLMTTLAESLMRKNDDLDQNALGYLEGVAGGAERMRAMINGLLEYSRASSEPQSDTVASSRAALEWAIGSLRNTIEETGATLKIGELPEVYADFGSLCQVFQHLLSNALKCRAEAPPVIEVSAEQVNGDVRFCVGDNGPGIDPAFHERLFGVFRRLHGREVPGAGIGLALCRRIVERNGGRIWVESEPNAGARFLFTLAAAEDIAAAGAAV